MLQHKIKYLVDSEFLKVIKIQNNTGNLTLTTTVQVNTKDNSVVVSYKVRSLNDRESHKFITKIFNNYQEAYDYYQEIYNKYKK